MKQVVIVGAGECGVRAALALREFGFDGRILLIGEEPGVPCERPPLSKSLPPQAKPIVREEAFAEAGIELLTGVRVEALDPVGRSLRLADGRPLAFDALLLATGARARVPPGMESCATLRTLADAHALAARLEDAESVGIVGGGFLGLELAATIRRTGRAVTVFEIADRLLARIVPAELADVLRRRHLAEGVGIRTGASVAAASAHRVVLADGTPWAFDLVIVCAGSGPETGLAAACGLPARGGIRVDEGLRTAAAGIFAGGDCCRFPLDGRLLRLESWKGARDHGEHVARAMLGRAGPFRTVPWFWSDQYDLVLQMSGLFDPARPVIGRCFGAEDLLLFQTGADGRLRAAAGISPGGSRARELRIAERLIAAGAVCDPDRLADPAFDLRTLLRRS